MHKDSSRLPSTRHHIGVVDPGPEFEGTLRRLPDMAGSYVVLTGLCGRVPEVTAALALERGLSVYKDTDELIRAHPETDVLAVCMEDPERIIALQERTRLPVIGPAQLLRLLAIQPSGDLWGCSISQDEKEDILQTLVREIEEDILLLDPQKRVVEVSTRVARSLGRTREELIGKYCWETWPEHGTPCSEGEGCPMDRTMDNGRAAQGVMTRIDPYGRVHYFNVNTYPILPGTGPVERVLEVRRDVTQQTHLELRLQQSEKMAAIGELSTYIAHEIRNPLFSLGGFANALLRSPHLNDQDRKKVRIILEESKRLDSIVNRIINFTRPMNAKSTVVDLNGVVTETMDILGLGLGREGIDLDLRLREELPMVRADAELIKRCLISLVKNALESMADGGRLTLVTDMDRRYVILRVTDTGRGIPENVLPQVFNPFFSTKHESPGLGLAMTKKIMEDLGGAVTLTSTVGQGTSVALFFPPVMAVEGGDLHEHTATPEGGSN
jgi:PAS domain S-box-containing protein